MCKDIVELSIKCKGADSVLLKTVENACGFYGYQFFDGKEFQYGVFDNFGEMFDFFYEQGFTIVADRLSRALILERR